MHGKSLLIASPLITALAFGTVDISQASVVPTASVSTGESHITHITAALKAAPPVCRREFRGQARRTCSEGYFDGRRYGCEARRALPPGLEDAIYEYGFNAGQDAGRRARAAGRC